MTVVATHSTPADGTFSAAGAIAWDANHTITGFAAGVEDWLATPSSANLKTAVTDETGSGALVFADTPTLVTPVIGVASGTSLALTSFITTAKLSESTTAGNGLTIAAGTATTDVSALSVTQTWNAAGVTFEGVLVTITDTASASGSLGFQVLGGASGTTNLLSISKAGLLTCGGTAPITVGANGIGGSGLFTSTNNALMTFQTSGGSSSIDFYPNAALRVKMPAILDGIVLSPSQDTGISRTSAGIVEINTGTAGTIRDIKVRNALIQQGTSSTYLNGMSTASVNTTAVGNVGAGEDDLMTYPMPTDSFSAAGKGVWIRMSGTIANTAETKTIKAYFGSVAVLTYAFTVNIAAEWRIDIEVTSTGTDAQDYTAELRTVGTAGVALIDIESGTLTQNDGAAITIKATADVGAPSTNDGIVQNYMRVQFNN